MLKMSAYWRHFVFILWSLIGFCCPVNADEGEQQLDMLLNKSLEELMNISFSTASKYQETTNDAPSVSTIVSAEEIERFGANDLYEVMERVTSVYMTGSNFFPKNVVAMRGTLLGHYDNHVLMLLNGRPMRESYSGGVNFSIYNAFPLQTIERLEIIRGPGSVLYGTNAYSGVINIITKQAADEDSSLSVGVGSYGSKSAQLTGSYMGEQVSTRWGIKYFQENGWDFAAVDNNGEYGSKEFGEENLGIYLGSSFNGFELNVLYSYSEQDFIGASVNWSGDPAIDERTMTSDRIFVDLGYSHEFSASWYLDANISYGEMEFDHYNYLGFSKDTFAELTSHWQATETLRWLLGGTVWHQNVGSRERLSMAPVPDFSSIWYSLYSQLEYEASEKLKLVAGAQLNKAEGLDADTVPRLGAIYQFSDNTGVKLMYAEAFRAAFGVETGFDLIIKNPDGSNRGGLRGNPSLLPESIKTTDVQFYFNNDEYQFALTLFESCLNNLVGRERAADNVLDFINEGAIESKGVELEAKVNLSKQLHLLGSYSYQSNQNADGIKDFTTVPNHMIKAGFIYYFGQGHSFTLFDTFMSEATDIAVQNPERSLVNPEADSYHLVTSKLSIDLADYFPKNNIKLEIYGYNLLDEDIYQAEFIGKRVNTLPSHSGRMLSVQFAMNF